jgi:hypothetical protein
MSRGDPVQASFTCTESIALATPMYVRDSKRQGLHVRYADDTFFYPFTSPLDSHLIISSIVVLLGCALRGRCIFYIFMTRIFPPAFPFPFFLS